MNLLPLLVEFLGAFLFTMSIFATGNAFIIGATLALIILIIGNISGGHLNPAVSAAMLIKGALTVSEFVGYTLAQVAGAITSYYAYTALA